MTLTEEASDPNTGPGRLCALAQSPDSQVRAALQANVVLPMLCLESPEFAERLRLHLLVGAMREIALNIQKNTVKPNVGAP